MLKKMRVIKWLAHVHMYVLWALVNLVSLCGYFNAGGQGGESGARLTLHILLRVFKANSSLTNGLSSRSTYIKSSCDLHLLIAANRSTHISPLLAVLKLILVLANTAKSSRMKDSDLVASLADAVTDEDDSDESSGSISIGRFAKQVGPYPPGYTWYTIFYTRYIYTC